MNLSEWQLEKGLIVEETEISENNKNNVISVSPASGGDLYVSVLFLEEPDCVTL